MNPFKKVIDIMLLPKNLFTAVNFFVANKINEMSDSLEPEIQKK